MYNYKQICNILVTMMYNYARVSIFVSSNKWI